MAVRPVRPLLMSLICAAAVVMAPASARAAQPVPHPSISYHEWTTSAQVYNRAQFENVWIPTSRSGGIAYVVHDAAHPLPPNMAGQVANW